MTSDDMNGRHLCAKQASFVHTAFQEALNMCLFTVVSMDTCDMLTDAVKMPRCSCLQSDSMLSTLTNSLVPEGLTGNAEGPCVTLRRAPPFAAVSQPFTCIRATIRCQHNR